MGRGCYLLLKPRRYVFISRGKERLEVCFVPLLFLMEGWGCVNLMILFNLRVFTFWFDTEKALFQVILGFL